MSCYLHSVMRWLAAFSIAVLLLARPVRGATYLVSGDRELIAASRGIVAGTVIDTYARASRDGLIETVTEVRIEERIKGVAADAPTLRIVQWGGRLGARWMIEPGAPRYARGERVLLFLDRTPHGDWTTHALALGSFRFDRDTEGNTVLNRSTEIVGWDLADSSILHPQSSIPHVERPRRADAFLAYVRAIAHGEERPTTYFIATERAGLTPVAKERAGLTPIPNKERVGLTPVPNAPAERLGLTPVSNAMFTSGSYTLRFEEGPSPVRRFGTDLSMSWRLSGTQGGLDFTEAVDFAIAHWNAQSPLINDERSPVPASDDTLAEDSETRIIAGDPHGEVPGSCCAGGGIIASAYFFGPTDSTEPFNGESFFRITHADIIVNDGVSVANLGQARFDTTMAHEMGHTLGLRHADRNTTDSGTCDAPLECCKSGCAAIMKSSITLALPALQPWDRNAVDCLYDAVCASTASCVPPSIANQPPDRTIVAGETTSLSIVASGTPPFTYQWYIGTAGDTSHPTGSGLATIRDVSPPVTTFYWARVSGQCAPDASSRTATVTVTRPCTPPSIVTQPAATQQVRGGQVARLSVAGTGDGPLGYAWFQGEVGDTSTPVGANEPDFTSTPLFRETKFWVRVTNGCGSVNSALSTVKITLGRRRSVR
jgi:metallopeptidase family M12-like protein